jgi:hypothetical protein
MKPTVTGFWITRFLQTKAVSDKTYLCANDSTRGQLIMDVTTESKRRLAAREDIERVESARFERMQRRIWCVHCQAPLELDWSYWDAMKRCCPQCRAAGKTTTDDMEVRTHMMCRKCGRVRPIGLRSTSAGLICMDCWRKMNPPA